MRFKQLFVSVLCINIVVCMTKRILYVFKLICVSMVAPVKLTFACLLVFSCCPLYLQTHHTLSEGWLWTNMHACGSVYACMWDSCVWWCICVCGCVCFCMHVYVHHLCMPESVCMRPWYYEFHQCVNKCTRESLTHTRRGEIQTQYTYTAIPHISKLR